MNKRPNVLIIMTDQQRWDALEHLSGATVKTPNINRLVAAGTTFTNCFTPSPLCAPARVGFATGSYPSRFGSRGNKYELPTETRTPLSAVLRGGEGANKIPIELAFYTVWESFPELKAVCWNYWTEAGMTHIHHADKGETEIAMSVGTPCYMDRAIDCKVTKSWYKIRSRHALDAQSGGINGKPTKAVKAEGIAARDEIVRILSEKVRLIIKTESYSD